MYDAADDEGPDPAAAWERLERAARAAASAVENWRRRAREAEAEVFRLRRELEELSSLGPLPSVERADELRRLRAENAVLVSRTDEARKRVSGLLARLAVLEQRR